MKRPWLFILISFLASFLWAEPPKATNEDPEFVKARDLFWSGRYDESEKGFKSYLLSHPNDPASNNFLLMIQQSRRHNPSKIDSTRKRLESIRVDKLVFQDTEWRTASLYLESLANPKKSDKTNIKDGEYINIINMLPSGFSTKISLDLRDITLLEAIEHACKQADLRFVIDTWAVIIDLPETKK